MSIADTNILNLPKVALEVKQLLPEYSGIYYVVDEANTVWYIGKAKNIRKRWQGKAHHRIYQLEAQKKKYFTIYYEKIDLSRLDKIEKQRIKKYHPHLNASPVKTKNVRPTETLLRETIAAISDFAFILGVEPPRKEVESQISMNWMKNSKYKNILELSIIHVCLDFTAFKTIFNPDTEEHIGLIEKIFNTRKKYANKWECCPFPYPFKHRIVVNGYAVEVNYWSFWSSNQDTEEIRQYIQTTLAQNPIRALTTQYLDKLKQQADREKNYAFHLQRLNPYTSDLIPLLFNEAIDVQSIKQKLEKVSQDYKTGKRGIGSRSREIEPDNSNSITIEELLFERGTNVKKYNKIITPSISRNGKERIKLYIRFFSFYYKKIESYYAISGIVDNQKREHAPSNLFDVIYYSTTVEKNAWLLIEKYLEGFASPNILLKNGEGITKKFYVSPRKYIVPAKVNIKLEPMNYSAWIPFGFCEKYPTFEEAKKEIKQRLQNANLPGLKLTFTREKVTRK